MKTIITVFAGVVLAFSVHAQDKEQKKAKGEISARSQTEKAGKEAEAKKNDVELDPNTRAKLNDIRYQIYNFGAKPGC